VGAHRRCAGLPGGFALTPELECHRAVEIVVARNRPDHAEVLEGGVGADRAGHHRVTGSGGTRKGDQEQET